MNQVTENPAIRLAIAPRNIEGLWPTTITFESGSEEYGEAEGLEAVLALAIAHGLAAESILYQGSSWIEINELVGLVVPPPGLRSLS